MVDKLIIKLKSAGLDFSRLLIKKEDFMQKKRCEAVCVAAFMDRGTLANVWHIKNMCGKKILNQRIEVVWSPNQFIKMTVSAWKKSKWHKGLL